MEKIRLQKFLAQCGVASRRGAEELIVEGRVRVNGQVVTELGSKVDPAKDIVKVGNRVYHPAPKGVIILHKPRNVVSTLSDPEGRPSIADYLTAHYRSYFPVGRLDYDSSGVIVLTNDGELAEKLLHPRYEFERVYEVLVQGWILDPALERIQQGVKLEDGVARGEVHVISRDDTRSALRLIIGEGRNRLVRRLMERLGHPVKKLKRVAHGPFKLARLQPGEIRKLTESEYAAIRRKVLAPLEERKRERKPRKPFKKRRTKTRR